MLNHRRWSLRRSWVNILMLTVTLAFLAAPPAAAQATPEGRWEGAIRLPGLELQVVVVLKPGEGGWQGAIDIPQQHAEGVPLQNVAFAAPKIRFELFTASGLAVFDGALDGNRISGTFTQAGKSSLFTLERRVADEPARRPVPAGAIPREVLFGNPEKASPRISPDGKLLAYLAPQNGVLNVWVRTIGQADDHVVTADKKRGIRQFFWEYDGEHVLYIQDRDGDENWHIYQTSSKTKSTRDLTPFEGVHAQVVAYDSKFPDTLLVALNVRDAKSLDVYRLNLKNGAVDLDTQNPGDVAGWDADNALFVRGAEASTPDGGVEIRVRNDAKSPWRTLVKWGSEDGMGGVAGFTADNKSVWVNSAVGANAARLSEYVLATGKSRVIVEDPQFDAGDPMINPKTRVLEAVPFERARKEWQVVDKTVQADFDALKKTRDCDFNVVSRDLDDKTWIVSCDLDDAPVTFYSYDRATKSATLLFTARPALEKYKLAKMQPISIRARDGMTLYGYLTLPPGGGKNFPMVLDVHGGPWGRDTWGLNNTAQWLANRGYAVLQINFRGSTGYGKAYLNAGDREWGAKMQTDLLDGMKWAVEKEYADPEKVCIMGGSYGGYATLVGVTFTPGAFACGVDIVGPSNLVTLLNSIPPYWETERAMFRKRIGDPEKEKDFLESRSPLFKADQIRVPLLVGQGANDPRVNQRESDQIVAAMRKNGKPVTYIVFPDEGHGFARPENRLRFYGATEDFLAKYLGGFAMPPSDKEKWDAFLK